MSTAPSPAAKGPLLLSILIITVGVGWLLTAWGFGKEINWIWTLSLGVVGVAVFVLSGGVDKASVLVGPFLLVSSLLSVLRQTDRLGANTEMPLLVILFGVLMMIAQSPKVPAPSWYVPLEKNDGNPNL